MHSNKVPHKIVFTTQEAAELLGISVTSVQQLVETGEIEAWKTKGGHRRIPVAAVEAYKSHPTSGNNFVPMSKNLDSTAILIVEDNEIQRDIYLRQITHWNLPVRLSFCENGYQALMEIARQKPDVLLADIVMEGLDGYEVVRTILTYPDLADMHIAILSGLPITELASRGGIPEGVVFFSKPINYDELKGYLKACCAQMLRKNNKNNK